VVSGGGSLGRGREAGEGSEVASVWGALWLGFTEAALSYWDSEGIEVWIWVSSFGFGPAISHTCMKYASEEFCPCPVPDDR
jgi:hypothetical protein